MRLLLAPLLLLSVACTPSSKDESSSSTPAAINRVAPYLWSAYTAPKLLQVSSDFDVNELANITAMSSAWETSIPAGQKQFFDYGARTPEITNSLGDLDSLNDGIFGVYKTQQWPLGLPSSALAVTQIFGFRRNAGTNTEFVDIVHADILINDDNHNFDTVDDAPNYDLRTVVLHEMGHFVGLQHKSSSSNRVNSVMFPSIRSDENKRVPTSIDGFDLATKYSLTPPPGSTGGGAVNAIIIDKVLIKYEVNPKEVPDPVKVLIELHADGECVHKVDGVIESRHRVDLN